MGKKNPKRRKAGLRKFGREVAKHIVNPGLTDFETLVKEFLARIERVQKRFPPGTPEEYIQAMLPLKQKKQRLPPLSEWKVQAYELHVQHLHCFEFAYVVEIVDALLWTELHSKLIPEPEVFEQKTEDEDPVERSRKAREFIERHEADVNKCFEVAKTKFLDHLRVRLGWVATEAMSSAAIFAITEKLPELFNDGHVKESDLRSRELEEWVDVQKERLGVPSPGAAPGNRSFRTRDEAMATLDEVKNDLKQQGKELTKNAVVRRLNELYPNVYCSDRKQLNRILERFDLDEWFETGIDTFDGRPGQ